MGPSGAVSQLPEVVVDDGENGVPTRPAAGEAAAATLRLLRGRTRERRRRTRERRLRGERRVFNLGPQVSGPNKKNDPIASALHT